MTVRKSQAEEDYLKIIYEMTREDQRAGTNQIARAMGVSAASATGMVQKLASQEPPLVDYQKHRGVTLTRQGKLAALEIIRHHRLIETFLHEKLGYGWDEVHEEADRLEHVISEELEERISLSLGDPAFDPHGDPIPDREFQMPRQKGRPLDQLNAGDQAVVIRIDNEDPALLRYLLSIGLIPQQKIKIRSVSPFDGIQQIEVSGRDEPAALGPSITRRIIVDSI